MAPTRKIQVLTSWATGSACFRLLGAPQNRCSRSPPIRQAQGMLPRGQGSREGEVCSFLRHSVRLVAEGVAGPARICNAGAGCRDTKVALRGRGGQVDGVGLLSRVFTATGRPQGTPLRVLGALPRFGCRDSGPRGRSLAWARVARMCVPFKRAGEIAGLGRIGGEKWYSRGEEVGRAWGWMWQGRERVARESDAFFGCGGANGPGAAGVWVGAYGGNWLRAYPTTRPSPPSPYQVRGRL